MTVRWTIPCNDEFVVEVVSTSRDDGDFAVPAVGTQPDKAFFERRSQIHPSPWTWLHQVHGTAVVHVASSGEGAGSKADAALTVVPDCPIAVNTADCAPVVLISTKGVAVVHAGWKGALAGVIEAAGEQLLSYGGKPVTAVVGPCISAEQYEFGDADLARIRAVYGPAIEAVTAAGTPGLDMSVVVGAACEAAGWLAPAPVACTSDENFFSHRTRGDGGRQTTVAWLRTRNNGADDGR